MKRIIRLTYVCLSMLVMISGTLLGCSTSTTASSTSSTTVTEIDSQSSNQPPSARRQKFSFSSYDELKSFFFEPRDDGSLPAIGKVNHIIEIASTDLTPNFEPYLEWAQTLVDRKQPIFAPYIGNELVYFDGSTSSIWVATRDWVLFRPTIEYVVHINGIEASLSISYLTEDDIQYASDHTFLELVKHIRPSIATPDDYDTEYYKYVIERTFSLGGQTVPAIHYEWGQQRQCRIITVYNDLMVVMELDKGFDESWLKDLSFQPLP